MFKRKLFLPSILFFISANVSIIFPSRSLTQNEFILPLGPDLRAMYEDPANAHSLSTMQYSSIRPEMTMSPIV